MLQINKSSKLLKATYKLQILFRLNHLNKKYLLKKKLSSSVFLRSPKHFNIGKQKIKSINYIFINLGFVTKKKIHSKIMYQETKYLFKLFDKFTETNTYIKTESIKLSIKTTFKIMWLEFWYLI
jgi:hypothetical protein